jgi:CheY-like chemotaxis protein
MTQVSAPLIMLIEADKSLQRLISLGLQHRDLRVISASSLDDLRLASIPDLLILDLDRYTEDDWSRLNAWRAQSGPAHLPIIALGWERPFSTGERTFSIGKRAVSTHEQSLPVDILYLPKPFDVRHLHRAIDQLLVNGITLTPEAEAAAEQALLASYTAQTPPSLLPLFVAASLLIAVIGLLLQFAFAISPILIVLVAIGLLLGLAFCLFRWPRHAISHIS